MASYRTEMTASVNSVSRIGVWAEDAGRQHPDLTHASMNAMLVCIQELVANIALHSRRPNGAPTVKVGIQIDATGIGVCIEDNGQPFDPVKQAPINVETDLASADVGGRGVRIVRQLAREMSYARVGEWNRVRLEIA